MNKVSWVVAFCIIAMLNSCILNENFPTDIIGAGEEKVVVIDPPCEYDDYAYVSDIRGMDEEGPRIDVDESFDYTDIKCRFYRSSNVLTFRHESRYGLQGLRSQVIDYSETGAKSINMFLNFWDGSSRPTYRTKLGKLYIEQDEVNKTVKFTWCNISLGVPGDIQYSSTSKGSFVVSY